MQAGAIGRVGAEEAAFAHSCGFINMGEGAAWRMTIPTKPEPGEALVGLVPQQSIRHVD